LRDSARETGQVGAAIQAEFKRGEVVGFYVKRRAMTPAKYGIYAAKP
jgi:hypothetical protein